MRPVPHLIDNNSKLGEYAMVFMAPLFLLRTIDPLFGLVAGATATTLYIRATAGKPEGHLVHLLYRWGIPTNGLLPRSMHSLVP